MNRKRLSQQLLAAIGALAVFASSAFAQDQLTATYTLKRVVTDSDLTADDPLYKYREWLKNTHPEVTPGPQAGARSFAYYSSQGKKFPETVWSFQAANGSGSLNYTRYRTSEGIPPPVDYRHSWTYSWKQPPRVLTTGQTVSFGLTINGSAGPGPATHYAQWLTKPNQLFKPAGQAPANDPFQPVRTSSSGSGKEEVSAEGDFIFSPVESFIKKAEPVVLIVKFRYYTPFNVYYEYELGESGTRPPPPPPPPPPTVAGARIEIPDRTVKQGTSLKIPVYIKGLSAGSGIANLNLEISYDRSKLRAMGIGDGNIYGASTMVEKNSGEAGKMRIGFAGKVDIARDGVIGYVNFKAEGVSGQTPLTINVVQAQNAGGSPVSLKTDDGVVYFRSPNDQPVLPPDNPFIQVGPPGSGSAPPPTIPPGTPVLGDGDGDQRLTPADARRALQMSVKKIPEDKQLDLSQNGQVQSEDARLILQRSMWDTSR